MSDSWKVDQCYRHLQSYLGIEAGASQQTEPSQLDMVKLMREMIPSFVAGCLVKDDAFFAWATPLFYPIFKASKSAKAKPRKKQQIRVEINKKPLYQSEHPPSFNSIYLPQLHLRCL